MSSAETLNFGPQWLRDLSGGAGSGSSSTSPPSTQFTHTSKFKLAENRYGREEMLALFVEDSEIPEELTTAPSLVSEIVQLPLAFRPSTESNQAQLSGGFRGRGGVSTGLRGRSTPGRGRGRGRGSSWVDHEDGMVRKPLLRRAESEDWRSDSLRGKGDGAEDIMGGLKEWRATGQRNDFWKDAWRDRPGDSREQKMFRSRSTSAKESEESSGKFWQDDHVHLKDTTKYSKFSASFETPDKDRGKQKREEKTSKEKESVEREPHKDIQESCNGDPPNAPSEPQISKLPEKPKKALEPVSEDNELHDTEQVEEKTNSLEPPDLNENKDPAHQVFEDNTTSLFQNFPIHDSGGALADTPVSSFLQEMRKTESQPVSLNETVNHPFSSNSPIGFHPALSNTNTSTSSPMARLQPQATTWFYKDPQGEVQGPFPSSQMMEWFNAGYFTMDLLVGRACDSEFLPLGELIKLLGQVPFTAIQQPQQKNILPDRVSYESNAASVLQQDFSSDLQKLQYNVKMSEHTQQTQPSVIGRPYQQQQQPDLKTVLDELSRSSNFLRMSQEQRQHFLLQYVEEMKRRSIPTDMQNSIFPITTANEPSRTMAQDSLNLLGNHTTVTDTFHQQQAEFLYQQKLLQEKARKEEEEIRRIQKQQEEQKELLKREEEEYKRRKDLLRKEQEEMERLRLETQRQKVELQRKWEEEEQLKKMQEMERRRKIEEEERMRAIQEREEEQRRMIEAEELRRKQEEEERRKIEQEELMRRMEQQRQEEIRRLEIEVEEKRIQEERRKQEEREKQMAKEAEKQRKMEAARIQKLKEEAEAKQIKIRQQESQMQQIQLPTSARWGQQQLAMQQNKNDSFSLKEIQKMEKEFEQTRLLEEARMTREMQHVQPPKVKTGWTTTVSDSCSGMSLLDIQREEAKQMSSAKQPIKQEFQKATNLSFNTSWNKPPKIHPDVVKPPPKSQPSFWDQVVEENPPKPVPGLQNKPKQQPKKAKAPKKLKGDEGEQVKAIFHQQITKDSFTEWCESYLEKMNVGSIDIPTFVNFLRDVESPYEVQEYVQSYLGESREVKDFANLFLEQRSNFTGFKYNSKQNKVTSTPHSSGSRDRDGFEMVTGNAKRGKKKTKKSQKVDPSILGFSVNAASNRVNMGEIETAKE